MYSHKYIKIGKEIFTEFKQFISRGNVLNLAVAVIVGGAFTNIVNALVNYVIAPLLGIFLGGINFTGLSFTLNNAVIRYGCFIQAVLNFLVVGFVVFIIVKMVNKVEKKIAEDVLHTNLKKVEPVSAEVKELREIKEIIKKLEHKNLSS